MITEQDLREAIAECQGQRNPNANTAIKLAAFLTIQRELFGDPETHGYSYASAPAETPQYDSGSEFSDAIQQIDQYRAWEIMDELMTTLQAVNPRLYNGVMRKIEG